MQVYGDASLDAPNRPQIHCLNLPLTLPLLLPLLLPLDARSVHTPGPERTVLDLEKEVQGSILTEGNISSLDYFVFML